MSRTETAASRPLAVVLGISSVLSALGVLALWQSGAIAQEQAYVLALIPVGLMVAAAIRLRASARTVPSASRRYLTRLALCMAFYLVTLFMAEILIEDRGVDGPLAALLAFLPGLAFAGVVWVFGALIVEEKDEFFRLLYVRQGLIGTGIAMTAAAVWGFLETYGIVQPVAAYWWPTIWCFGIGVGAVFNKVKYGTYGEIR